MPLKGCRLKHPLVIQSTLDKDEILNSIKNAVEYNIKVKENLKTLLFSIQEIKHNSQKTAVVVSWIDTKGNSFEDVLYYQGFFNSETYKVH